MILQPGDKAPDFTLDTTDGTFSLSDAAGKWLVLYFYPRDNTPGCTIEAIDFSKNKKDFEAENAVIVGVSPDTVAKHESFTEKKELTITLGADPEKVVCNQFGVWQIKKNYGREYEGVMRTTYLIDPSGRVAQVWSPVKVKDHAEAVLTRLKELKAK